MRILAADVGGTKTLAALFEGAADDLREVGTRHVPSAEHGSLEPILEGLLAGGAPPDAVAVGVPGPVEGGVCVTTNLPWVVDRAHIAAALRVERVSVLNDFAACALGIGELDAGELSALSDAPPDPRAPVAVLGAGTGLGEAILVPSEAEGALPRVLATEGGHTDWAPRDELDVQLFRFLSARHGGRVSVERVLSGPGLAALYDFLVEGGHAMASAAVAARVSAGEDPATVIGELGAADRDATCRYAVERFVAAYGAEAGNLALKTLPFGGLFVAGGIAPKLAPLFARGDFMRAFLDKGRMRSVLERVPVHLVQNPRVGLLGARRVARASLR